MFLVYLNKVVFFFFSLIIHSFYHTQCHSTLYIYIQKCKKEVDTVFHNYNDRGEKKMQKHSGVTD